MRKRCLIVMIFLLIGMSLGACDDGPPATPTPPAPTSTLAPPPVPEARPEVLAVAGMRAQVLAAQALIRAGQDAAALQHAFIPPGELLPALGGSPQAAALTPALQAYVDVMSRRAANEATATDAAVAAAHETALAAIDQALAALAGADLSTRPGRAGLIKGLLARMAQEYDAAVRAGGPADRGPYETAYGYLQVAHEQYTALKSAVGDRQQAELAEIEKQFAALDQIFPAVSPPPAQPPPSSTVQAAVDAINRALDTIAGAPAPR